jgi:hypothetical protein
MGCLRTDYIYRTMGVLSVKPHELRPRCIGPGEGTNRNTILFYSLTNCNEPFALIKR